MQAAVGVVVTKMLHHLMVGTWTPPGAIFTFEFDDEKLSLKLVKRTEIPHDESISSLPVRNSRIPPAGSVRWICITVTKAASR